MENKDCPQCGSRLFHNKGISAKNNRPYENWKCGSCKHIEWVDIKEKTSGQPQNGLTIIFDDLMTRFNKLDEANKVINDNIKLLHKKVDKLLENGQRKTTDSPAK